MPIEIDGDCERISDQRFDQIDYEFMGKVFEAHREMGKLCEESNYQTLLSEYCKNNGLEAKSEVEIQVRHKHFEKSYFIDLLIEGGVVIELKAVKSLRSCHEAQLINYLMLAGLQHGKLINMKGDSVRANQILSRINSRNRFDVHFNAEEWKGNGKSDWLNNTFRELIQDLGAFLNVELYREAIRILLDQEAKLDVPIEIWVNSMKVGTQRFDLLESEIALKITAIKDSPETYENHLQKLLSITRLSQIQWININNQEVVLKTIR